LLLVDKSITVELKPVRIVYRPEEIARLQNFMHVDAIKEETKFKASARMDSLRQTLKQQQKMLLLHESKKLNKLSINVESPVLELPFSNNA
jgi:hypothetical protein